MTKKQLQKEETKRTNARLDGLTLLVLGAITFLMLGVALERAAPAPSADFRALYYPARALVGNADLYDPSQVNPVYQQDSALFPGDTWKQHEIATRNVYPPSAFTFMLPFAAMSWGPAHIVWLILTVGGILYVSLLIWNVSAVWRPLLAGALLALFLLNSELLVISSNAAGIVVSLGVLGVCCFLLDRYVALGIVCMALSLAMKPQETGLVWLYFLLAGGVQRKRALQTLAAAIAIGLPGLLWTLHVSPHWMGEWHNNLAVFSAQGGINDPGPASAGGHGLAMVISLQALLSVFRDDARFYNLGSYLICAPLVLVWGYVTVRTRMTTARAWLALASIAAISMLPVYHRQYDSKLLLLAVPAGAMLWAEGGRIGRIAIAITTAALVFTGDLTWAILLAAINHLNLGPGGFTGWLSVALQVFPSPLILLAMGIFYLWVYALRSPRAASESGA